MPRGSAPGERRGGRKKGTPNKRTQALKLAVAKVGITPLEFMLQVLAAPIPADLDETVKVAMLSMKLDAAKGAAPYCHARVGSADPDLNKGSDAAQKLREAAALMRDRTNSK